MNGVRADLVTYASEFTAYLAYVQRNLRSCNSVTPPLVAVFCAVNIHLVKPSMLVRCQNVGLWSSGDTRVTLEFSYLDIRMPEQLPNLGRCLYLLYTQSPRLSGPAGLSDRLGRGRRLLLDPQWTDETRLACNLR